MYIKGHVETVDTKDQSNAIVYWVWHVVCIDSVNIDSIEWFANYVDMKIKACNALNAVCRHCLHWCLWLLHNTVYRLMRCENCTLLCIKCIDSVDIDSIECIRDPCLVSTVSTYIILMVWLKSPKSQLSKTFFGLKISWISKKLLAGMCGCVLHWQCWHR